MKSASILLLVASAVLSAAASSSLATRRIAIEWKEGLPQGHIGVTGGTLASTAVARGHGAIEAGGAFRATEDGPFRLELEVSGTETPYGPSSMVTVETARQPFTFFMRDVRPEYPILLRAYGVAVTTASDHRSYAEIDAAVRARGLRTKLETIESEPEESFAEAAAHTRSLSGQTWLGLARDIRIFAVGERLDWVQPRFHGEEVALSETANKPNRYEFLMGRGWGAVDHITRRLEDGVLPILHGELVDDDITYRMVAFAGLENDALTTGSVRGTPFLVADGHGAGHMFTKEQQSEYDRLAPAEMSRDSETVLYVRIVATNTAVVPRYAFFKNAYPSGTGDVSFDGANGLSLYRSGRVFSVTQVNGRPLTNSEAAISLAPGETATIDMFLPHRPISRERALKLREANFDQRHAECRAYWQAKLAAAASIHVPEPRIDEMLRAGLLHLDLVTYGLEPRGTLTPTIGVYSAIASESSPIVQFMDSMGWHDTAQRALQYFLDKQHEDGFIQNFGGYMLETGAALWSLGEHYRYTRDDNWVRQIAPQVVKSCEYLRRWRARNLREELRGKGYGMLEGKTADPEDPFRSFMLNGYAYLGLERASEMLERVDPAASARWLQEANALKADIRTALFDALGRSPVIPLGDGSWIPTAPPWVGYRGPLALYAEGGQWFTHGAMVSRDSLLGPLYLVFQEVLDPSEPAASFLLEFHNDLMTTRNVAFSQPYYSRHPVTHLRRGEVKPFLKAYYNTVASLADRETYSFWEHYFHASPHKTHEEAWFLMDTRWMLYMEHGPGLELLAGIPRAWLENGKRIELKNVATYFGPVSLEVASSGKRIEATVTCETERKPAYVELRLPHPSGRAAIAATGGRYDARTERIRIEPFDGRAKVVLEFQ
jgi:hypothetical protein